MFRRVGYVRLVASLSNNVNAWIGLTKVNKKIPNWKLTKY